MLRDGELLAIFPEGGLSLDGLTFALVAEDELYLKADALNRPLFEAAGGFATDYVLGDFEDSDLCLALRADAPGTCSSNGITTKHSKITRISPIYLSHRNATLLAV